MPICSLPKPAENEKGPIISDRKRTQLRHDDILQDKRVKRSNEELLRPSNFSDVTSDDFGDVDDKVLSQRKKLSSVVHFLLVQL